MVLSNVYKEDRMSTMIEEVRGEIQGKLDELMAEIEPLQNALKALGDNGSAPQAQAPTEAPQAPEAAPVRPQAPKPVARRGRSSFSDEAIIDVIRANPNAGAALIRQHLGGTSNAMSMRLTKLVKAGQLVRLGERRNTHYRVAATEQVAA